MLARMDQHSPSGLLRLLITSRSRLEKRIRRDGTRRVGGNKVRNDCCCQCLGRLAGSRWGIRGIKARHPVEGRRWDGIRWDMFSQITRQSRTPSQVNGKPEHETLPPHLPPTSSLLHHHQNSHLNPDHRNHASPSRRAPRLDFPGAALLARHGDPRPPQFCPRARLPSDRETASLKTLWPYFSLPLWQIVANLSSAAMVCGNFCTADRADASVLLNVMMDWNNDGGNDNCTTPARTCRRHACNNTSGVYVGSLSRSHPGDTDETFTGLQRQLLPPRALLPAGRGHSRRSVYEPMLPERLPQGHFGAAVCRRVWVQRYRCVCELQPRHRRRLSGYWTAEPPLGAERGVQAVIMSRFSEAGSRWDSQRHQRVIGNLA